MRQQSGEEAFFILVSTLHSLSRKQSTIFTQVWVKISANLSLPHSAHEVDNFSLSWKFLIFCLGDLEYLTNHVPVVNGGVNDCNSCMSLCSNCWKILDFLPLPWRCFFSCSRVSLAIDVGQRGPWRWPCSLCQNPRSPSEWQCATLWCPCWALWSSSWWRWWWCLSTLMSEHVSDKSPLNVSLALNYFLDTEKGVETT